jgi:hypothetical protein
MLLSNLRRSSVVSLMRHLKKLGLASVLALVATCGVVGSASATLIEPGSTAFTLTSTNFSWSVSGGGTVSCSTSTISGTTPAVGVATSWKTIAATTLAYSGCTALGFEGISVTSSEGCHTAATSPKLHFMGVTAATAISVVTIPAGCSIDFSTPSIGCTLTIPGPQTIGNGTAGAGGIDWTDLASSTAHFNAVLVPTVHSNGVGFGCATAGNHTMTWTGNYTRSSATNVTVTP